MGTCLRKLAGFAINSRTGASARERALLKAPHTRLEQEVDQGRAETQAEITAHTQAEKLAEQALELARQVQELASSEREILKLNVDQREAAMQSEIAERTQAGKLAVQALELAQQARELARSERQVRKLNDELERRVVERTAQLEAANKELETFTYSVSHDLRAPLRHISGFSRILIEEFGPKMEPEARAHVQRIDDGARRMGQLVDGLLNLARVARHDPVFQVTGLDSVVREVVALLQPECEGRVVEWKIADLPATACDPILIKQVFQNLINNALKFSRRRERTVIEIGHRQENGQMVITVADNGVGFDMKYRDKLFGVFQRLHRPEDFEGTGIGLATVQRIIHKHGGRVWAEGELDKGATFCFTLGAVEPTVKSEEVKRDKQGSDEAKAKPVESDEVKNKIAAAGAQA
jgi:signal transduction histidine kinase